MDNKEAIMVVLGKRLRIVRNAKRISQEKLAEYAQTDKNYISEVERGLKQPTIEKLYTITQALDINIEDLFKGIEEEIQSDFNI
ncbi:helix-turn-helix domain-containing protein [Aquibacillus rhizosphaerae]|uniref:Helix-turn-helix transcriptional regulator n=1 Tax=Aquibacillus rhizosphaerae TaxID=3051431 RepID=A0ABT7L9E4_9BACI|nr:helix-turn-helix transcriptional regulator [Aquibacillus sp. LR5S19]MDL4842468.1 helix-turn-helix transcriptional regulator [Aquibacillus sp. LR5S19]